jgi:CheY-like chemotaxis protein
MDCSDLRDDPPGRSEPVGEKPARVLAAVSDLMFVSKIAAAARLAGCPVEFFRQTEKLAENLKEAIPAEPCLVIVDLNEKSLDPVTLIAGLKAAPETRRVQVIAYLSHVQHELKREAEKAGADLVLPRSVFSQNLYDLLRQHSCHL